MGEATAALTAEGRSPSRAEAGASKLGQVCFIRLRLAYQSVRAGSPDFGQVGFEPRQEPIALKPAIRLGS
jgi:hypothetical protein